MVSPLLTLRWVAYAARWIVDRSVDPFLTECVPTPSTNSANCRMQSKVDAPKLVAQRPKAECIFVVALVSLSVQLDAGKSSRAETIASIVAFGDSLTDAGRLGRFTDDVLWVEQLASRLHVPIPKASNRGGTNYAASGAATENITAAPDMDQQVADYLFSHTPTVQTLFVLWGGHNDLFGHAEPARVVDNLAGLMTSLYNAGARQFMVPSLAPIDLTPREVGGPNQSSLAAAVALTNSLLFDRLSQLQNTLPQSTVYMPDAHALMRNMVADFEMNGSTGVYGFENVTQAALLTGGNVATFMWLDVIHPTSKTHVYIGDFVAAAVPEPAAAIQLLVGGVAAVYLRFVRRSRRNYGLAHVTSISTGIERIRR